MLAFPSMKKMSSKYGCECESKFQIRLCSSKRSQNWRVAWSSGTCSRNLQMASRSTLRPVRWTSWSAATLPDPARVTRRSASLRDRNTTPGFDRLSDRQCDMDRTQPVEACRGRSALAADGGGERGDIDLVQVAPVLGLHLALAARVAEQDGAGWILDHGAHRFDAALRAENLETGRRVGDRERVVRLDERAVGVAQGGHHRVLGRSAPRPLGRGERHDVRREGTQQRVEDRSVVAGDVHRDPATSLACETPALESRR